MKITYLGHSAFEIRTNKDCIIIDPYLVCSPNYNYNDVTNIFVTHGHGDHLGSAFNISRKTNAPITAIFELANYCSANKVRANGVGLGAWINYSFGRVIFVPAFHSSSAPDGTYTGCPAGIIFEIEGKRIYHAGDTCLNSEMKVIKEVYKPDVVMLPIGGVYTMDVEAANIAAKWLDAPVVIPMHYNTFEAISANITLFNKLITEQGKKAQIMPVGDVLEI